MYPFKKDAPKTFVEFDGMTPRLRYSGAYRKSIAIAEHYGFRLVQTPTIGRDDRITYKQTELPPERVALMRTYLERGFDGCTHPVHVCYTTKIPYQNRIQLQLDIIGTNKSAAETLLLHTALTILKEHNIDAVRVGINSIGGEDSIARFTPEVINYYRQRLDQLDADTRQAFGTDPFEPLRSQEKICRELCHEAPQSIAFLSERSRTHFYEILESLERLGVPYRIDHRLIGRPAYTRHTVFEIHTPPKKKNKERQENNEIFAFGQRYDYLAKRAGLGRHIPALGITIELPHTSVKESLQRYRREPESAPHIYFIQLGSEARQAVLLTAEELRHAEIRFRSAFAEDRLREQLEHARTLNVPVLVIIGHKEATNGTVMIRNQHSRAQQTIPRGQLISHLQKMLR